MQISCGTDIIEVERIKSIVKNKEKRFLSRVFTEKEIEYCESKKVQKYQHYAARFAAKEATFKAISGLLENKYSVGWKDFEILNDEKGRPFLKLYNIDDKNIDSIDLSISHCKLYATANVVVIYKN